MNNPKSNHLVTILAAAEVAHQRATGGGMGDVAIYIQMRSCNVMMNERLSRLVAPHGLTAVGYITMMALYSRPENLANPSELCDYTGETRGNMTRICDELFDNGWMRRVANVEDRRRVDLSLTKSGMELLDRIAPQLRQSAEDFYRENFTVAEKVTLQGLLAQFSEGLSTDLARP